VQIGCVQREWLQIEALHYTFQRGVSAATNTTWSIKPDRPISKQNSDQSKNYHPSIQEFSESNYVAFWPASSPPVSLSSQDNCEAEQWTCWNKSEFQRNDLTNRFSETKSMRVWMDPHPATEYSSVETGMERHFPQGTHLDVGSMVFSPTPNSAAGHYHAWFMGHHG
jgi:hypothetical protein